MRLLFEMLKILTAERLYRYHIVCTGVFCVLLETVDRGEMSKKMHSRVLQGSGIANKELTAFQQREKMKEMSSDAKWVKQKATGNVPVKYVAGVFSHHGGGMVPEYANLVGRLFCRGQVPAKFQVSGRELSAVRYAQYYLAAETVNAHAEYVVKNLKSAYKQRGQRDKQIGLFDFRVLSVGGGVLGADNDDESAGEVVGEEEVLV